MREVVRRLPWPGEPGAGWADLLAKEWLVTNGLGGYASGTVCGVPTRRFHGLLVAALPAPLGRTMMLNDVVDGVPAHRGQVKGYHVGGKTGTTLVSIPTGYALDSTLATFVGFAPVEDPAAAVALGGAPTRVLLTLIDGHVRYRRDEFEWRALTAGATRARSLLLQAPSATRAPT